MSTNGVDPSLIVNRASATCRGWGSRTSLMTLWLAALAMSTTLRVEVAAAQRPGLAADADILSRGQAFSPRRMQDDQVRAPSSALADLSSHQGASRTHWKRGALISAVVSGAAVYALVFPDGAWEERAVVSLGFGAIIGWIPGALIGGQFPRGE